MPRKYYAVRIGRDGTQIYDTYAKFMRATSGLSGASGKGFDTIEEALQWLNIPFGGMATMLTRTDANVNLTVNITNHIIQPSGGGPPPSSVAATTVTTSVAHDSRTLPRQLVHHAAMASCIPPNIQQPRGQAPPPVPPEVEITLSEEQENILDLVRRRKNIFFTGAAGAASDLIMTKNL
ncbi:hypothetical protein EDC04DRAFT_2638819 [Pisolithus marmoratus]|nr:hypothetical protein EDC04DRAFT_2638819 [Pisolithus marmoratus]